MCRVKMWCENDSHNKKGRPRHVENVSGNLCSKIISHAKRFSQVQRRQNCILQPLGDISSDSRHPNYVSTCELGLTVQTNPEPCRHVKNFCERERERISLFSLKISLCLLLHRRKNIFSHDGIHLKFFHSRTHFDRIVSCWRT